MGPRLRIGLTGGIASGKSTAAKRFLELGVPVVDADELAREAVAPGEAAQGEVVRQFGPGVLTGGGELDRRALRDLVFADPTARRKLEAILHPRIRAQMQRRAALARGPYVIMAIPLLAEGGGQYGLDRVLLIDAAEDVQLERLMARDGGTLQQARAMLAAQAGRRERLALADDVIENTGSIGELQQAVDRLHRRYLDLAAAMAP
jgi:dephospho-CoA kinase